MTEFELRWHTDKYEDVITAVEKLAPSIFKTDLQAAALRAQIDALHTLLYTYVLENHCEKDNDD